MASCLSSLSTLYSSSSGRYPKRELPVRVSLFLRMAIFLSAVLEVPQSLLSPSGPSPFFLWPLSVVAPYSLLSVICIHIILSDLHTCSLVFKFLLNVVLLLMLFKIPCKLTYIKALIIFDIVLKQNYETSKRGDNVFILLNIKRLISGYKTHYFNLIEPLFVLSICHMANMLPMLA